MTDHSKAAMWGAMLKYYREKAGLSQSQLADLMVFSAGQVASVETGRRGLSEDFAVRADEATGADGALVHLFLKLYGHKAFLPGFEEFPDLERRASMIRGFESTLIPGLLQTEDYARIMLQLDGDEAVAARLARQAVLDRDKPPVVRFVIEEWVIRRPVGPKEVMYRQLEHIEEAITSGRAHVQVLRPGVLPDMHGSFALATVGGRTVGYVESTGFGRMLTDEEDVHWCETIWDRLLAEAMNSGDSLELIRRVKEELWNS